MNDLRMALPVDVWTDRELAAAYASNAQLCQTIQSGPPHPYKSYFVRLYTARMEAISAEQALRAEAVRR